MISRMVRLDELYTCYNIASPKSAAESIVYVNSKVAPMGW